MSFVFLCVVYSAEMSRSESPASPTESQAVTSCVRRLRPRRRRCRGPPARQHHHFRCAVAASPTSVSPNSASGERVVSCLYRKIRARPRRASIEAVAGDRRCGFIDHVVDVDYSRSAFVSYSSESSNSSSPMHEIGDFVTPQSVGDVNALPGEDDEAGSGNRRRHDDDVVLSSSKDSSSSSSPAHDVSESVTSRAEGETGSGSRRRRRVEIVLRYGVGRLGVAVGGERPVRVRIVRPGGEGQRAGLAVGDEIVDVEGRDVRRARPEVVADLLRSWTGRALRLVVARREHDDSGHASSSSSSPDDVTDTASGYNNNNNWLPPSRDANHSHQSTSGQ